ncbi:MAG: aspartate kinase [Planctomycetota bacterium]
MTVAWQHGVIRGAPARPAGHVVKVGGSLLDRRGWPDALALLLTDLRPTLVVVGGGQLVDGLRAIDAACPRPARLMHDLAIDAMSLTARLVADAIGLPLVREVEAAAGVLDAAAWLRAAGPVASLPVGWHVTSDSIAAVVAGATGRRLVLAKSVPPPVGGDDLDALAAAGWVDAYFPFAAAGVAAIAWAAPRSPVSPQEPGSAGTGSELTSRPM